MDTMINGISPLLKDIRHHGTNIRSLLMDINHDRWIFTIQTWWLKWDKSGGMIHQVGMELLWGWVKTYMDLPYDWGNVYIH